MAGGILLRSVAARFPSLSPSVISPHFELLDPYLLSIDGREVAHDLADSYHSDLVKAVKESFTYCDPAYLMPDARATQEVTFFGQKGSRLWVLTFNYGHDSEHYGNIVTYLRMKGLVPPSSQGGM